MQRAAPSPAARSLRRLVEAEARAAGFEAVGVTRPDRIGPAGQRLRQFVEQGRHGEMDWMADRISWRAEPAALWPQARSIVMVAQNYGPEHDPLAVLDDRSGGAISVYARHRDYHDVVKGKLKQIAGRFAARSGHDVKVFVDTAPVMEKPLAEASGMGWQGKHTNLVSREFGSWLFLGSIFTTAELEPDEPERDHCGSCRACLDICPTKAFPAPYQLDARRCISYLTIEHKGPIPREFRSAMGNRIYGCDDCLAVCPWNKFARAASEAKLAAPPDRAGAPRLAELLALDDPAFRRLFAGSPVKRIGRDRFLRNVLIAAGNSADLSLVPHCLGLSEDPSPLVRGAAIWALTQLLEPDEFADLAARRRHEPEPSVRAEWLAGVDEISPGEAACMS